MTNRTNRIRVVHIIPSLVIGGMEQVVKTLALGINPERFDVSVICILEKGVLAEALKEKGIEVHVIDEKRYKILSHLYPRYLARAIKEYRPHIIHSHSGIWYASAVASKMAEVPVMVHTEHGRHFPEKTVAIFFDRISKKLTDRLVCVSEELARYMTEKVKVPKNRIEIIKNGIALNNYRLRWVTSSYPLRSRYGIPDDAKVLVTAGRLESVKGQEYLLEAFFKLIEKYGNIFLWILGDGSLKEMLLSMVKSKKLENTVFFTGNVDNVNDYLCESDVFVLPSLSEGTPMALLEAMASGLPIVATKVGENETILDHGKAGFLVHSASIQGLNDALSSVLANPEISRKMGEHAYRSVYEKFSSQRMIEKYEELYIKLLKEKDAERNFSMTEFQIEES